MANKFLGLDSINVLTSYIDQAVSKKTENGLVLTIQAYKYIPFNEAIETPVGGGFDFNYGTVIWPDGGWNSLKGVLDEIGEDLTDSLMDGSIYMSSAVITGKTEVVWSRPMRVSGQNGVSVRFAYSFDREALEEARTSTPQGVNATNRVEYVWTKEAEGEWDGPTIWSMYSEDADNVLWRYCVTKELKTPTKPSVGDSNWSKNLVDRNLSKEYPYMWMSSQIVPAGQEESDGGWSEPILFGHWGMDGNVPDYNVTLYRIGGDLEVEGSTPGIVKPAAPVLSADPDAVVEDVLYSELRTLNPDWKDLPEDDDKVWWQCTIKVNGQTGVVMEIGSVKRYNAVDGQALPGQFTKYLYRWSEDHNQPEFKTDELKDGWSVDGWFETPDYHLVEDYDGVDFSSVPEASLWMTVSIADGYTDAGVPKVLGWSAPVRITGPRGPISYDYRMETRYTIGTSARPKALPTEEEWRKEPPSTTSTYPYIWAAEYLVCYKMRYDVSNPNEDGTYPVETADGGTIVENYGYYRASGLDGEDGNRKNAIKYVTDNESVRVTSFSQTNLFIANSESDSSYTIALDQLAFVDGYTGRFCNIGKGNMTISTNDTMPFVASCTTATSVTIAPQESIELVCHNNGKDKELILIGKDITPAEPTE
jgi:hypothetical protein